MRHTLPGCILLLSAATASAKDLVYDGTWLTTNRKLDGTLTCVVKSVGNNQWRGHFSGVWNGQPFAYTVDFSGSPEKLRGRAVVDGADYEWTGDMSGGRFVGKFWGSRYLGSFDMRQKGR